MGDLLEFHLDAFKLVQPVDICLRHVGEENHEGSRTALLYAKKTQENSLPRDSASAGVCGQGTGLRGDPGPSTLTPDNAGLAGGTAGSAPSGEAATDVAAEELDEEEEVVAGEAGLGVSTNTVFTPDPEQIQRILNHKNHKNHETGSEHHEFG